MKLLLISNDESIKQNLHNFTEIHGGSIMHYKHPLKGMDNYDEIEPDVVLFNSADFPRHWKLAAQALREKWNRKRALFILITDKDFPAEEADKAAYLGVNALATAEDLVRDHFKRLELLVSRYRIAPERSDGPVFHTLEEPYPLMFMNPKNLQLISGTVERQLLNRLLFFPSEPASLKDLPEGTLIRNCSLERKGRIEILDALVKGSGEFLELELIGSKEMKGIA
ncbi:MAG: hypothetical protein PQJ60_11450 [Spirochaetales bacterium]|nr:hypothetical protein [Spirochaetales bacterium]